MKIAVAVPLRTGVSQGFVKYLVELLSRWSQPDSGVAVDVILPEGLLSGTLFPGVSVIQTDRNDYRTGFRQMGAAVTNGGYDVCLLSLPRVVPIEKVPLVSVIQNIEPLQKATYRMPLLWRARLWALQREQLRALKRSTRIIAISQHVKQVLAQYPSLAKAEIDVIYHGFNVSELLSAERPSMVPEGPFLFSAGSLYPYRGFEDVVGALASLKHSKNPVPTVLLTGVATDPSWYARRLRRLISAKGVGGHIQWAGVLHRAEMNWCYQHCSLYVQTSRAEACPNIVLEALGHGCDVVSCDTPPMPEILGASGDYYPSGDAGQLAALIQQHLVSPVKRDSSEESPSRQRIKDFAWEGIASQTLEALRKAAGRA